MICYDSVTASNIPLEALMVGGYIDGKYAWSQKDWDRFPKAIKMHIVVNPSHNAGDVYDCEPGNGHPQDAGPWAKRRNEAGIRHPCVYCSNNEWWPAIRDSVSASGATGVVYWIADYFYDKQYHPIVGSVGVQYIDVGPYDLSVFTDITWLVGDLFQPIPVPELPYKKKGTANASLR